ncbi:MAG: ABC transporter permease [Pseudomonadota bacterium]
MSMGLNSMLSASLGAALRNYRRAPLTFLLNLLALSLGLFCFLAAWATSNYWQSSDKHFSNADRIEIITQGFDSTAIKTGQLLRTSDAVAKYLDTERRDIEAVARFSGTSMTGLRVGERAANLYGSMADPALFKIFDFAFVEGDPVTALSKPDSLVLTHSAARKLFGDQNALGRDVTMANDQTLTVAGVLTVSEALSHFGDYPGAIKRFDYITAFEAPPEGAADIWFSVDGITYVLLSDKNLRHAFRAGLNNDLQGRIPDNQAELGISFSALKLPELQSRVLDFRLFKDHIAPISVVDILYAFGAIILLISCLNYTNMSIAQATRQARHVAMQKVLGARRARLLMQAMIEAIIIAVIAGLIALVCLWMASPAFEAFASINIRQGLFQTAGTWVVLLFLIPALGITASFYTGAYLLSIPPVAALRSAAIKGGSSILRNLLVGVQFFAASVLLIFLLLVSAQNQFLMKRGQPENLEHILLLTDPGSRDISAETWRNVLRNQTGIEAVSTLDFVPWTDRFTASYFETERDGQDRRIATRTSVSSDFCAVFQCELKHGQVFDPSKHVPSNDRKFVLVDTDFANALDLGNMSEAVGRYLYGDGDNGPAEDQLQIVGFIEPITLNFGVSPVDPVGQIFVLENPEGSYPAIRISPNQDAQARASIESALSELNPNAVMRTTYASESFEQSFRIYRRIGQGILALSGMAFIIALLGLFGLASFLAARRRHEIGVRKTLGAKTSQIIILLVGDFLKPIVIANLMAWPVAWFAARAYLSGFSETITLTLWPWLSALLITFFLGALAVGGQAYRAARVSPTLVLRHD